MKKSTIRCAFSILAILLAIAAVPQAATSQAEPETVVSLPETTEITTCEPTDIPVRIENVVNLTAYSLHISFTPGSIQVLEVVNGGFLDGEDALYEPINNIDNENGEIRFGMAQRNSLEKPLTPRSGDGDLIVLTVQAVVPGETIELTITEQPTSTLVSWPDVMPIDFRVENGVIKTRHCPPTDIALSKNSVVENMPAGTEVGVFSTTDPEPGDTDFTYALVDDTEYPDNAHFSITGDRLMTEAAFNYEAKDTYTIQVRNTDPHGEYLEREFTIQVIDANDSPVLDEIGELTMLEEIESTFTATATDEDNDPLKFSLKGDVPDGAGISEEGVFTWTPTEEQGPGVYTFDVCVTDIMEAEDCKPVTITVTEVNVPPVAEDLSVTTDEDIPLPITLIASDVEANVLNWYILTDPAHGTLSGDAPELTYTPNENWYGTDSFTFKVNDGTDDSNTAQVTITVNSVNDAPVAAADTCVLDEGTTHTEPAPGVLANDSDVEGDELTAVLVKGPAHGSLTLNPDGSFTYTPDKGFAGMDAFEYRASDGEAVSNTVQVTITVNEVIKTLYLPLIIR